MARSGWSGAGITGSSEAFKCYALAMPVAGLTEYAGGPLVCADRLLESLRVLKHSAEAIKNRPLVRLVAELAEGRDSRLVHGDCHVELSRFPSSKAKIA